MVVHSATLAMPRIPPKAANLVIGLSKQAKTALLLMNRDLSAGLYENSLIFEQSNHMELYHCRLDDIPRERDVLIGIMENDVPLVMSLAKKGLEAFLLATDRNGVPVELVGDLVIKSVPRRQTSPISRRDLGIDWTSP